MDGGYWRGVSGLPGGLRILLALAMGVLVAFALRRRPRSAQTPLFALLLAAAPFVPLLTGRLLALTVFQGPVLWLLAAAVAGVVAARALSERVVPWPAIPAWWLLIVAFVFYALLGLRIPGRAGTQGDEPHYLTMAISLLTDGDLDLTDEYAGREHASFYPFNLTPHVSPSSPPGRIYSSHLPGLAFIIAPAYALGGYPGARLLLSLIAALTGVAVYRLARDVHGPAGGLAAWALWTFLPPGPFFAVAVYPEAPAALAVALMLLASQTQARVGLSVAAVFSVAALPWLHTKFVPLALAGLLLLVLRRQRLRARVLLISAFIASLGALLAYLRLLYGQASLSAAFGPAHLTPLNVPRGLLALFLDRQFGLVSSSPIWALAVPGSMLLFRTARGAALRAGLMVAALVGVAASFGTWWAGASAPGRFLLPTLPALALCVVAAARVRPGVAGACAGLGLGVVGLAASAPHVLWNRADGESRLLRFLSSYDLSGSLPTFFDDSATPVLLALTLAAAAALVWRWRRWGWAVGLAAFILVSTALRTRPVIDQRFATLDLWHAWEPARLAWPLGAPDIKRFAVPFELAHRPWLLTPNHARRRSRRIDLPPGDYRVLVVARNLTERPARCQVEVQVGAEVIATVLLDERRLTAEVPLSLPDGAQRVFLFAQGHAGKAELLEASVHAAWIVPVSRRPGAPVGTPPDVDS
jgi:hypothetical protein